MKHAQTLLQSADFISARQKMADAICQTAERVRRDGIKPSAVEYREQYEAAIRQFQKERGRDLYYPILTSGIGGGPFVELQDGSVKLDMITGIGINFFGHAHPAYVEESLLAATSDVMQGNLQPGYEAQELLHELVLSAAPKSRIEHGWLTTCGTMANEIALKIVRQKRTPATKIFAFTDCFAGRSTAMQEITDNPKYRDGQPIYGEVHYLPFYDEARSLSDNIECTVGHMRWMLDRYPGKFAAIMSELVQGEGGFSSAPREFFVAVFEEAHKHKLAVWIDEVQTFGRTGELFAFQKLGIESLVDVVTVGKLLQACAVLYTNEFNPKPGLVAGTFSGSATALRTARRTLKMLKEDGFLGANGKIEKLSARFASHLRSQAKVPVRAVGGMIAFQPYGGTMDDVKKTLMKLFDLGVIAFSCGHGPYWVRMLPPLGVMTEAEVDLVCQKVQEALSS